jgi:hypothetical protein
MAALFQGIVGAVEAANGSAAPLSGSAGAAGSSSSSRANRAALGATGTVSVTMNEQQMRSKLRPTSHWGTLSGKRVVYPCARWGRLVCMHICTSCDDRHV